MPDQGEYADEVALGTIGLIVSLALLKANEIFDYFDKVEICRLAGSILTIRGRELIAVGGFAACYVVLLLLIGLGMYQVVKKAEPNRRMARELLFGLVLILLLAQFFAFSTGFSHGLYKYTQALNTATEFKWDWGGHPK